MSTDTSSVWESGSLKIITDHDGSHTIFVASSERAIHRMSVNPKDTCTNALVAALLERPPDDYDRAMAVIEAAKAAPSTEARVGPFNVYAINVNLEAMSISSIFVELEYRGYGDDFNEVHAALAKLVGHRIDLVGSRTDREAPF